MRFRAGYGAAPVHLLAIIVSFVIVGAAFVNWFHARTHIGNILVWYVGCLLAIEFILIPLAWVLDRTAHEQVSRRGRRPLRGAGWAYVRIPAMLSGLMLIVFLPLILRLGDSTFRAYTGMTTSVYLIRWLTASAAIFACSALLYAARLALKRRSSSSSGRPSKSHQDRSGGPPQHRSQQTRLEAWEPQQGRTDDGGATSTDTQPH